MNLAKYGGLFQELKWFAEKSLEPEFESCTVPRTAALAEGEACLVSRNNPMHDSVPYLFNDLAGETDILHEYFIPRAAYNDFISGAREITGQPAAAGAQRVDPRRRMKRTSRSPMRRIPRSRWCSTSTRAPTRPAIDEMRKLTRAMIDLTLKHGGRFFLPYQLHYTAAQLLASYPELPAFLAKKTKFDPGELFTSTFYRAIRMLSEAQA